MVEWTFRRKEEWLVRKGVTYSSSVGSARYMFFLANASNRVNTFGQVIGCALLLDNKIIATQISLLNPHMTENIHIAYDFAMLDFRQVSRTSGATRMSAAFDRASTQQLIWHRAHARHRSAAGSETLQMCRSMRSGFVYSLSRKRNALFLHHGPKTARCAPCVHYLS